MLRGSDTLIREAYSLYNYVMRLCKHTQPQPQENIMLLIAMPGRFTRTHRIATATRFRLGQRESDSLAVAAAISESGGNRCGAIK